MTDPYHSPEKHESPTRCEKLLFHRLGIEHSFSYKGGKEDQWHEKPARIPR